MTIEEIRENAEARRQLTELLRHPWMIRLLVALEETIDNEDVPDTADPISSTRKLSRAAGERAMLKKLREVILPFQPAVADEVPTYGTEMTEEEAAAAALTL